MVFSDDLGLPHRSQTRKTYDTIVRQSGLKHRGFHALRHTHSTNLFDADFDILTISERLGHSSVAITLDIYTHLNEKRKKKTAKRLHELIKTVKNN